MASGERWKNQWARERQVLIPCRLELLLQLTWNNDIKQWSKTWNVLFCFFKKKSLKDNKPRRNLIVKSSVPLDLFSVEGTVSDK